ncbi:hypothetical protein IFM89_025380 [Coptis chinensis]|uniref:BED-type domain-containing protein n=1 Tax=Coptis chinensis TaxID=261450 RepID=A0A835IRI3_9MAGN|nr:hypothetical protein IFM89_025380 [Coptis chinensis]
MANMSALILDTVTDVETPIEDGAEGESVNFHARPPKNQKRKISDVWTQFDKTVEINDDGIVVKNDDGSDSMVAICKICFQKLSCGNRGGTSHLRRHKESCLNRTATNTGQTIIGVGLLVPYSLSPLTKREPIARLCDTFFVKSCHSLK